MNPIDCAREAAVLEAVLRQQIDPSATAWPDGDTGLHRHLDQCGICADVAAVASLLRADREFAHHDVQVPAAGQVWWRAAVRARVDGAHAAARPLTWANGIAAASTAGVAVAIMGIAWPTIENAAGWLGGRAWAVSPAALGVIEVASAAVQRSLPFALAAVAGLVLAPLALYLVLLDE